MRIEIRELAALFYKDLVLRDDLANMYLERSRVLHPRSHPRLCNFKDCFEEIPEVQKQGWQMLREARCEEIAAYSIQFAETFFKVTEETKQNGNS